MSNEIQFLKELEYKKVSVLSHCLVEKKKRNKIFVQGWPKWWAIAQGINWLGGIKFTVGLMGMYTSRRQLKE